MIEIDIPGFGVLELKYLVSDFSGTLSVDGLLLPGVAARLNALSKVLQIHVVTADTHGKARQQLQDVSCLIHMLSGANHDMQKEAYAMKLGWEEVAALGNGKNDRRLLKAARLGIAVTESEGSAVDALLAADIHVRSAVDGLDLLLNPVRCKATLRY